MRFNNAFWKYYRNNAIFNVAGALLLGVFSGFLWSAIIFCSIGVLFGWIGFDYFYKNQYYFYYNLGFTKQELLLKTFLVNIIISVPFFLIIIIVVNA